MSKDNSKTLLIVEDDIGIQSQLRWHFDQFNVVIAGNREEAIAAVRLHEPPVVLQDLGLPPDDEGVEEGFRCVQEITKLAPSTKIIVVTGNHDYENAVRAVALGAYDFYQKPIDTKTLDLIVQRAYNIFDLENENTRLQAQQSSPLDGIITAAPQMLKLCKMIEKIAPTTVTCTILGESGTGKEVFSRAIHNCSPRREARFVAINCAAVPENLMESELFGYEKGAFTGAAKKTLGKIETANGGTLFLDEIGDMPLNLQAKLLRFLQERVIERVGGRDEIPVDVRVVCATNKNLEEMVKEGTFREDLFYRICEMVVDLPPLRERAGDKVLIARHILAKVAKDMQKNINGFTSDAAQAIETYDWPGNIRELENKIKRAAIMCDNKQVSEDDLGITSQESFSINLRKVRQDAEVGAIKLALTLSNDNYSNAAKLLGITRPTLYDLVKKYDIQSN